jgi:hypothetical protein
MKLQNVNWALNVMGFDHLTALVRARNPFSTRDAATCSWTVGFILGMRRVWCGRATS